MNVYILTEGGENIGFGHISRCLAIAQSFENKKIKPQFIISSDNSIDELLKDYQVYKFDWHAETSELINLLSASDIVIVDSYLAFSSTYEVISNLSKVALYIDDFNRLKYPKGMVLNSAFNAKDIYPSDVSKELYLLGSNFVSLRKEFWYVDEKNIKESISNVMVTFGGDDSENVTSAVTDFLSDNFPEYEKTIIVGSGFKHLSYLKNTFDEKTTLVNHASANQMKDIMSLSDLAISAGGQTLYELARVGVPTIAVSTAENQVNNILGMSKQGMIKYVGWYSDKKFLENLKRIMDEVKSHETRCKLSNIAQSNINGQGTQNIVDRLLGSYEKCLVAV